MVFPTKAIFVTSLTLPFALAREGYCASASFSRGLKRGEKAIPSAKIRAIITANTTQPVTFSGSLIVPPSSLV